MKFIDMTNQRFGRLIAKSYAGSSQWNCLCDCGNTCVVASYLLRIEHTKSCGCYRVERGKQHGAHVNKRHGEGANGRESIEYKTWANMLSRCNNVNHQMYPHYGARGIKVCERWHVYENFLADMGRRPEGRYSIDRINNDGNYEPNNCRWATSVEQNNNKRLPKKSETGTTKVEIAKKAGVSVSTITRRLRKGMTIEQALIAPLYGR